MQTNTSLKSKGVEIKTVFSDKYKTNSLSLNFLLPIDDENISRAHVLSSVLLRGCEKYPTMTALGRKVNMLYDPIVSVRSFKTVKALVFCVSVSFIDGDFLPEGEGDKIFSEITDILYEILIHAFPADNALFEKYTESEKKLRIDAIRAEKNNKDSYALRRCQQLFFEGNPIGCNGKGTEKCVSEITSDILRKTLNDIILHSPVIMMYAGRCRERDMQTMNALAEKMFSKRDENGIAYSENTLPDLQCESREITEDADASQGRAVLAYKTGLFADELCKVDLFNEIFGASPVSRLFMNVREKLQLCYYCSSSVITAVGAMFVRSGVSNKNREKAINEINAQLESLKAPENISDFEFDAAVLSIKNYYLSLKDDAFRYAEWAILRHIDGRSDNVDDYIKAIESYTKEDVSDVARTAEMKLNFFLNGTARA